MAEGGIFGAFTSILSPSVLRASPFIVQGVNAGLSANEILRTLSTAGLGIRRTEGLRYIKSVKGTFNIAGYQRGLKGNVLPNPSLFNTGRYKLSKTYSYVVRAYGTDTVTGSPAQQHITITSDTVLTNDDIAGEVEATLEQGIQSYRLQLDGYDLEAVLTDPAFIP